MPVGIIGDAEDQLVFLRHLSTAMGKAFTADEVARASLTTLFGLPHLVRAGLAVNAEGGRNLQFVGSDDALIGPGQLEWCLIDAYAELPLVDAVRHDASIFLESVDEITKSYEGYGARQREIGVEAVAALCLSTDSEGVGALLLGFDHQQVFDDSTQRFLETVAALVTPALRKGLAYQAQRSTAQQLQRNLMPRTLPPLDGLELGSHYQPGGLNSDVGGDWYDVLELPDGVVAIAVGDVMGKGTAAAVVMGEVRSALRAYALLDPSPSKVLERLDALVSMHPVPEQLVTVVYGIVDRARGRVTLAMAGHPPPLLAHGDEIIVLAEGTGSALGVGAGPWPEVEVELDPDTTLVLYSDGLVERRDRELTQGISELADHVRRTPARRRQPRDLCARLADQLTGPLTDDDVTLLAISARSSSAPMTSSTILSDDHQAPGQARRFLRTTLAGWSVDDDTIETAELCVSELVTNAVIHTGTAAELAARLDDEVLTVSVRDRGGEGTIARGALDDPMTISGRGLALVDALSTAWSAERSADGTTVWFELEAETTTAAGEGLAGRTTA